MAQYRSNNMQSIARLRLINGRKRHRFAPPTTRRRIGLAKPNWEWRIRRRAGLGWKFKLMKKELQSLIALSRLIVADKESIKQAEECPYND